MINRKFSQAVQRVFAQVCLGLLLMGAAAFTTEEKRVPLSKAEAQLSFAPIVKAAAPSVVNVYASRVVREVNPFINDPVFRHFFGGQDRSQVQNSLGSGVIVDATGIIVTNNHVIANATDIKVVLQDRREFEAEVMLKDERTDLAVLKLKTRGEAFPPLSYAPQESLEVGDLVLAIGNPYGIGQTVTQGIVSALARTQVGVSDYQSFIQTDAAINPGNSGGALVDTKGQLIGINTAIFSRTGGSHGIGFAIPSSMVRVVVESAKSGGQTVRRPWFGAGLMNMSADVADSLNMKRPTGALVVEVPSNTPAARGGIKVGDVILQVDGQEVSDPEAFGFIYATKPIGGKVEITVLRQGKETKVSVALELPTETTPRDQRLLTSRSPMAGATIVNLSPAIVHELGLNGERVSKGVMIMKVEEGSPAESLGLQKGDLVISINGKSADNTRSVEEFMSQGARLWRLIFARQGRTFQVVVGG